MDKQNPTTGRDDLIEFRHPRKGRRLAEKLGGGIVEYPKTTKKASVQQVIQNPDSGRIAARMIGTIPLPKRQAPEQDSRPQGITQPIRCICCGALAHEVTHDS